MSRIDPAFEAVLRDTHSVVRAYIAGLGVPLDTVDDLAQEVYLEFYKSSGRLPADLEPVRWLKGIARNLCMDHFRRSRRKAERHLEAAAVLLDKVQPPEPDPGLDSLDPCLEKLPHRSRELIALRYAEGMESGDIGRRVGLSPEAVRVGLLRIRATLRDCLDRRDTQEEPA